MKTAWAFAALTLLASNALADEACGPLKIVGQAVMLSTQNVLLVPAVANGHPIKMIFDTGGWFMELSPALVKTLDLPIRHRGFGMLDVNGRTSDKSVTVGDFEIGSLKSKNVTFMVSPDAHEEFDGLMGPQLVDVVDVDLDFTSKKINFVLQDHCPGKVVYWKTPSYGVVPFVRTDQGHIRMPVELDGVKFTALLDTGASRSFITQRAAEGTFGITKDSPGVTDGGPVNGDKAVKKSLHTFKTLTVGGITFNNPVLEILPDLMRNHLMNASAPPINSHIGVSKEAEGLDDVVVGLEELRHLHVYIAYKEEKVYISPIGTASPAPASSAPPAPQTASP